ncbi:hypothetical protein JR316_0012849 [Psilocybe cubensis]|uniref:Uncharacterized protein n=2 Tax=Psilocybe cubensis TaxID=181762 RepID=A0ACB8GFS0_PSICU|nr:hypothetical protein JR316_0012849 [Psilocybe cubensis]KAH9474391.1 hypothetical protein JR316_0012849 [Psilocybe cubensis]
MSFPASPTGDSPLGVPHDAIVAQKQGQAILIWTIGAFCIFGWDYIVCLPREYQLVWKRPKNLSTALYLTNRYFGIVQFSIVVSLISGAWSLSSCQRIFFFQPVAGLISTIISQLILGGRVYAIFSKSNTIGIPLLTILVVEAVICAVAISKIPPSAPVGLSGTPQPQCGVLIGPFGWLVTFWTMPLLFDTITFVLTAWRAYDMWKKELNIGTHGLFKIIWRDGLIYFFAIFSMNTINVIIFLTTAKPLRAVNLPATLILQVVLSCRLVLNLRESHTLSSTGSSRVKVSGSVKLRSVTSHGGISSGQKRIQMDEFNRTTSSKDVPDSGYTPDAKGGHLPETWSPV